jgi:hypothetical protein
VTTPFITPSSTLTPPMAKRRLTDYNSTTLEASGLHVHLGDENLNPRDDAQLREPNDGTKEPLIKCKPEVEIQMLTSKEVHRRTGFCDLKRLLSYVAIMCNGNFEKMITTTTMMTRIEEWVFFLEYTYGKTRNRWVDYAKDWNLCAKSLRILLNNELEHELPTRLNWPMYAFVGGGHYLRERSSNLRDLRTEAHPDCPRCCSAR